MTWKPMGCTLSRVYAL